MESEQIYSKGINGRKVPGYGEVTSTTHQKSQEQQPSQKDKEERSPKNATEAQGGEAIGKLSGSPQMRQGKRPK